MAVIEKDINYVLKNLGYLIPVTVDGDDNWSLGGNNDMAQIDDDYGMIDNYCAEISYWKNNR